jgi:hypothetical protein
MQQISMDLPGMALAPSPAVTAINKALRDEFPARAREFVLTHLRRHGPTSGEDLTDAMLLGGIRAPGGKEQVFGHVYREMHREELVENYGVTYRRKGNGTLGATIWRITPKGLKA